MKLTSDQLQRIMNSFSMQDMRDIIVQEIEESPEKKRLLIKELEKRSDGEILKLLHCIKELLEDIAGKDKGDKPNCFRFNPYRTCAEVESVSIGLYNEYYDVFHNIKIAAPDNPLNPDSNVYNREPINATLKRNADVLNVANQGTNRLFIIVSHLGTKDFSVETPIFPGTVRTFYNVYEVRLRSAQQGLPYSVSEYSIAFATVEPATPDELANISGSPLPATNIDWLSSSISTAFAPSLLHIQVAVSIGGIFSAVIGTDGIEEVVNFNEGDPLVANALYHFTMDVHDADSINFRYSTTGGTILNLRVHSTL